MEDQLGDCFKTNKISFQHINQLKPIAVDYLFSEKLKDFYNFQPNWNGIENALQARHKIKTNRKLLTDTLLENYQEVETTDLVKSNIQLLSQQNTFTFTTGHQLNLFTGPSYFFYKIISVLKLCISAKSKFPDNNFVPIFWMASEDHDFDEISRTLVNGKKIAWQRDASGAVGRLDLTGFNLQVNELKKEIGLNPKTEDFFKQINHFLGSSKTYGEFVFRTVNSIFKDFGLVVLDADQPNLKRQLTSVIQEDIFHHQTYKGAQNTSAELTQMGYGEQILVREINFFYLKDNIRERIEKQEGFYKVLNTSISFSDAEMLEEIKSHPENFSPNVALRPVYQEILLPNLAYVGGGAEVAYWLQLKQSFKNHETFFPVVLLRDSVSIINKKAEKWMLDLDLSFEDLFENENSIFTKLVKLKTEQNLNLDDELNQISSLFDEVKNRAEAIQPTLQKTVEGEKVKILKRLKSIEKKFLREEKRHYSVLENKLTKLLAIVYPNGVLQERKANFLPYYLEYKNLILNELLNQFDPSKAEFKFVVTEN